jgi:phosphopantothenoylcysteine decarboxylase/phosphopantothenate--cysteine ligase
MLRGKNILLGVTASIAAYKAAHLIRLLKKAGAHVQVVMTPASLDFTTPLTLATLSGNPCYSSFVEEGDETGVWNNHVDLALWADYFLIAPCSANTLAKMAHGECDNLLMACYLSAKCPVFVAPAMDLDMYQHGTTTDNLSLIIKRNNTVIPAESGELASGLVGEGRMAEPENIIAFVEAYIAERLPLYGKKALVTAGPTYEAIDPVRFIGNRSSGKMGIAIAEYLAELGAEVHLICGPSSQSSTQGVMRMDIHTADEMDAACKAVFSTVDLAICAAAVADYKPRSVANQKIKKKDAALQIDLAPTPDILAGLGAEKTHQVLVGFALETENEEHNAKSKLERKNLDLIVLNSLQDKGAGFGHDTNKITLIDRNNKKHSFGLKSKQDVAKDIVNHIVENHFHA